MPRSGLVACVSFGLLANAVACDSWITWRRRAAIDNAQAAVESQRAAMTLVGMKHGFLGGEQKRLRVAVRADRVQVDNAAWLSEFDDAGLDALAAKGAGDLVVHRVDLSPVAPVLSDTIARAVAIEKAAATDPVGFVGRADLVVDAATPFLSLVAVLEAAARAGISEFRFAVDNPHGERFIAATAPSACAQVEYNQRAAVGLGGFCAVPEIEVRSEGVLVRTRRRAAQGKTCKAEIEPGPAKLEWDGRVMLPNKKLCPSLPMVSGKQDTKGLVDLLKQLSAIVPGCTSALITAGPTLTWEQVAPVVVATTANSPFVHTALVAEGKRAPGADLDCTGGLNPQALPVVAARLAKSKRDVKRLSIMGHLEDLETP